MAIPLRTQLFWKAVTRATGTPLMQLPADEVAAARDKRRKLLSLPGAALVAGRPHPDVYITTKTASGADGASVPVRIYRPAGSITEPRPLVMNYHGGGFISGDAQQSEWWCSSLAHDVHALVVSVDYRLAPEHQFPIAAEDCHAATVWAIEHAGDLGADPTRVVVMGDSAGGNLAAVVAMMARDRGTATIAFQLLMYPAVDLVNTYTSEDENEFAPVIGKADLHAHDFYCPDHSSDPYASPLLGQHVGLPPALIQTAQHDPLRDQGAAYADALRASGVEVRLTNYVDAVHGYISLPGVVPAARQALAEAVAALTAAFAVRA